MLKPCLDCGEPSETTRCDEHRRELEAKRNETRKRKTNTATWQRLSRRIRRLQPWCSTCGVAADLTVDHVIPVSQRPDLEYEVANLDVLCRSCNSRRGDRVTDEERAAVLQLIATRRRPRALG